MKRHEKERALDGGQWMGYWECVRLLAWIEIGIEHRGCELRIVVVWGLIFSQWRLGLKRRGKFRGVKQGTASINNRVQQIVGEYCPGCAIENIQTLEK